MPNYRAPGVYVEEVPSAVRPIAGVGTSTAGFVGVSANITRAWDPAKKAGMPARPTGKAYEQAAADVHPTGDDEGWWHSANALWLASREYLRRNHGCDAASKELKEHGPERLGSLHTEYELEASALLGMRHAADAYKQDRPTAA